MKKSAELSQDRKYRYALYRVWDEGLPLVMLVGLNPSTADEMVDDPTIRRCIKFAKAWGFGGLVMVNLFAYRSTDPSGLKSAPNNDPVGPENNEWILRLQKQSGSVVVAWGNHGNLNGRNKEVLEILEEPYCLEITKQGHPKHPLYIKADTKPRKFK